MSENDREMLLQNKSESTYFSPVVEKWGPDQDRREEGASSRHVAYFPMSVSAEDGQKDRNADITAMMYFEFELTGQLRLGEAENVPLKEETFKINGLSFYYNKTKQSNRAKQGKKEIVDVNKIEKEQQQIKLTNAQVGSSKRAINLTKSGLF